MGMAAKVIGVILIILGLVYAAVPHDMHTSWGIGFGQVHAIHMVLGIILIIIGLALLMLGRGKKPQKAPAEEVKK